MYVSAKDIYADVNLSVHASPSLSQSLLTLSQARSLSGRLLLQQHAPVVFLPP